MGMRSMTVAMAGGSGSGRPCWRGHRANMTLGLRGPAKKPVTSAPAGGEKALSGPNAKLRRERHDSRGAPARALKRESLSEASRPRSRRRIRGLYWGSPQARSLGATGSDRPVLRNPYGTLQKAQLDRVRVKQEGEGELVQRATGDRRQCGGQSERMRVRDNAADRQGAVVDNWAYGPRHHPVEQRRQVAKGDPVAQ